MPALRLLFLHLCVSTLLDARTLASSAQPVISSAVIGLQGESASVACPPCTCPTAAAPSLPEQRFQTLLPTRRQLLPLASQPCGDSATEPLLLHFLARPTTAVLLEVHSGGCAFSRDTGTSQRLPLQLPPGLSGAPLSAAAFYALPPSSNSTAVLGWLIVADAAGGLHTLALSQQQQQPAGGQLALTQHPSPACAALAAPGPALAALTATDAMQAPLPPLRPSRGLWGAGRPTTPQPPPATHTALLLLHYSQAPTASASLLVTKEGCSALSSLQHAEQAAFQSAPPSRRAVYALDSIQSAPTTSAGGGAAAAAARPGAPPAPPRPLFHRLAAASGVAVAATFLVSRPLLPPATSLPLALPSLAVQCPWEGGSSEASAALTALSWAPVAAAPGRYLGVHSLWGGTAEGHLLEWAVSVEEQEREAALAQQQQQEQQQQQSAVGNSDLTAHPLHRSHVLLSRMAAGCVLRHLWQPPFASGSAGSPSIHAILPAGGLLFLASGGGRLAVFGAAAAAAAAGAAGSSGGAAGDKQYRLPPLSGRAELLLLAPEEQAAAAAAAPPCTVLLAAAASTTSPATAAGAVGLVLALSAGQQPSISPQLYDSLLLAPAAAAAAAAAAAVPPTGAAEAPSSSPPWQDLRASAAAATAAESPVFATLMYFLRGPTIFLVVALGVWWNRRQGRRPGGSKGGRGEGGMAAWTALLPAFLTGASSSSGSSGSAEEESLAAGVQWGERFGSGRGGVGVGVGGEGGKGGAAERARRMQWLQEAVDAGEAKGSGSGSGSGGGSGSSKHSAAGVGLSSSWDSIVDSSEEEEVEEEEEEEGGVGDEVHLGAGASAQLVREMRREAEAEARAAVGARAARRAAVEAMGVPDAQLGRGRVGERDLADLNTEEPLSSEEEVD